MKINANWFMSKFKNWGYWLGGLFFAISLLSLVLGLKPLLVAAREKLRIVDVPGQNVMEFRIPGSYIAVFMNESQDAELEKRIRELEYLLTDATDQFEVEITKIPSAAYMSEKREKQIPLFQFIINEPGRYVLRSAYPYDMDGPKVQAIIFNMDLRYVRAELIIGIMVCLIFAGLAIYCIRKNYKRNRV